jgi:mRNA interferase MazF
MHKGDIVLIPFPYTNLSGQKLRPAVILNVSNNDIIACFITSQLHWQEPTDVVLVPNKTNGLKIQSLLRTSKIATLHQSLVRGLLGRLTESETIEFNIKLKELFQLP